jgi:hypothetical protein
MEGVDAAEEVDAEGVCDDSRSCERASRSSQ